MPEEEQTQDSESVAERLSRLYENLTTTERKPARVLLDNYPVAGLETVAQFAARSSVSGPTILRLIGKLGFEGYADFQAELRSELEARLQSPLQKHPAQRDDSGDEVDAFCRNICDNIRLSMQHVPRAEISGVCQLLADCRRSVYLIGGRFSDALAQYFYMHLHAMRAGVRHVDAQRDAWPDYLVDIKRRDVVIIFDMRRYQAELLRFAEDAAARGAQVVLFTDQWLSPIAKVAKHVFSLRIKVRSSWDSSAATLALIELLLARLSEENWGEVAKRMETLEEMRRDLERRDAD